MKAVLLLVTYQMKAGMRNAFLQEVAQAGILEKIRQERGCLQYAYFLSAEDPDSLLLIEKWESPELQQAHLMQPHMEKLKEIKPRFVEQTIVEQILTEGESEK